MKLKTSHKYAIWKRILRRYPYASWLYLYHLHTRQLRNKNVISTKFSVPKNATRRHLLRKLRNKLCFVHKIGRKDKLSSSGRSKIITKDFLRQPSYAEVPLFCVLHKNNLLFIIIQTLSYVYVSQINYPSSAVGCA